MNQLTRHTGIIHRCAFIIAAFVLVAALADLTASSAAAQTGSAVVRTDPPTLEVGQGQVENLNIVIDNARDVYGIEVRAKFDPGIFEIVDSDPTKDGVQMVPGDFIKPDFLVRNTVDNQKGTLQYVITQVNPTPPANGSGVVLSIWVRGKTQGKRSPFTIDFVQIADRKGVKLAASAQNGTVSIVQPKPPTPTATANATATLAATATPRPLPTQTSVSASGPTSVPASGSLNDNTLLDALLLLIAFLGCFGGLAVIGASAFVIIRRPTRVKNPRIPNPTDGTRRP